MAWLGHIDARFEFNFLIFGIATRPYFLGHCLLAHLRKGKLIRILGILTCQLKGMRRTLSSFSVDEASVIWIFLRE
jgi:hypothetical protein